MLGTAIMELSEEIVGAPVILIWIRDRQSFCSWKFVFHKTNLIIWRNRLIYSIKRKSSSCQVKLNFLLLDLINLIIKLLIGN